MADQMPGSDSRIMRDLERRIEVLEAQVRQVRGVPVTQASTAFFVPDSSPSTPSGGVYLYASGGTFRWRSSSGADYSGIPPTVPKAGFVSDPNPLTAGSAPGSYSSSHSAALRADIDQVRTKLIALRTALVASGLMWSV